MCNAHHGVGIFGSKVSGAGDDAIEEFIDECVGRVMLDRVDAANQQSRLVANGQGIQLYIAHQAPPSLAENIQVKVIVSFEQPAVDVVQIPVVDLAKKDAAFFER